MIFFHQNKIVPNGFTSYVMSEQQNSLLLSKELLYRNNLDEVKWVQESVHKTRKFRLNLYNLIEYKKIIYFPIHIHNAIAIIAPIKNHDEYITNNDCKIVAIQCYDYNISENIVVCHPDYYELAINMVSYHQNIITTGNVLTYLTQSRCSSFINNDVANIFSQINNKIDLCLNTETQQV